MNRAHRTQPLKVTHYTTASPAESLRKTVELIGSAIEDGSIYLPIRAHAGGLASTAAPKDYLGQIAAIYNDFIKRWRYVHDPLASETITTTGPAIWQQTMGASAKPGHRGWGDCDDATTAIGSMISAIGLPVRIKTIAGPTAKPSQLFTHVYPQAHIPRVGWVSVDAVGHPAHGLGWTPPAIREATWTTGGDLVDVSGVFPPALARMFKEMRPHTAPAKIATGVLQGGIDTMNARFQDYGLDRFGLCGTGTDGGDLEDFAKVGLLGFGAYAGQYGIIDGPAGIVMEVDDEDETIQTADGLGLYRTKMLEMDPQEINYCRMYGRPRLGVVALSDDGDVYQYVEDPALGGFFKKLFKKAKKGLKKVLKKGKKFLRKIVKKLPGGKYLLKLHDKIHKISMKLIRPLRKLVGKFAKKLAPIAALIPGYGPAIAAGLYTAGKIAKVMGEFDVRTDKKGKPKFKSGQQAKAFQIKLAEEARQMQVEKQMSKQRKRKAQHQAGLDGRRLPAFMRHARRRPHPMIDPRLLQAGSKAHRAAMRGLGIDLSAYGDY